MSELLTMQDMANGHLDVKALGEAANGDENTIVTTRTGRTYPSAERAINIMFQSGGLPAKPFATKALMTASALVDGDFAMVTDDTVNNGLYIKTAGAWVKSAYDPLGTANKNQDANTLATFGASRYSGQYPVGFVSAGLGKDSRNTDGFVVDTAGNRIFSQKYMEVFDSSGKGYRLAEQEIPWGIPVANADYLMYLYLNKSTRLFSLVSLNTLPSDEAKKDLLLCAIITRYNEKITFLSNAPFSIDYGLNGVSIAHEKADINPAISNSINKQLPNYDTSNQTLTFPTDTVFKYRDIVFATSGVTVVNTKNPDELSSIVYVYWDLVTNDLAVKTFNTVLTANERYRWVLVATIRDSYITTPSVNPWQGRVSLDMNCEFTINGVNRFQGTFETPKTYLAATVTSAAAGKDGFGNLPNYNTKTKSFEFSSDTLFRSGDTVYIVPTGGLVVPCIDPLNLSTAVIVYWNKTDNTFHIRKYNYVLKSNEVTDFVRVAAVRDALVTPSSAHWSTRLGIDTTMMYTIDGIHPFLGDPNKESEGVSSIDVHSEPMVRACAHRGFNGAFLAPENTLPAFKMAADYGFWGAETDLRLTSDGHWVLMHDETIDKTTTGTGAVADLTLAQIRSFDANHGKPEYVGVKVPTLEEYLTTCKRNNIVPYMQTYVAPDAVSIIPLAKAIREITGEQGTVVISFSSSHLYFIREHLPKMPVELLVSTITEGNIATAKLIGNCSLGCSSAGVTKEAVRLAAESGVRVSMWANNLTLEQYIDMNVLRVTSDYAIPPNFDKGFQKLLIKNEADWSNFTESSAFTGTVTNGAITIPPTQDVSINLGSHPLGVLIVEFYATSTSEDSEMFVYAGRDIKTGVINSLSPTHKFSCLIRNNAEADVVVTFRGVTGTLTLQDLKIKVFEV